MNRPKKCLRSVVLTLTCACGLALAQEPSEVKAEPKFEVSENEQRWVVNVDPHGKDEIETREQMVQGSFRPRYVAVFYVRGRHADMSNRTWRQGFPDFSHSSWIKSILATSPAKALSQQQIELLHTGSCIRILGGFGDAVGNHQEVRIYGVSKKDAEKTVEAFMETLTGVSGTIGYLKRKVAELQEQIPKTKKQISEKETKLESTRARLDDLEKSVHYLSVDEAKAIVLELNKTLNTLDVEIAGLEAKISTIEKYKSDKTLSLDIVEKLEEMLREQAVELAGALARKDMATQIRDQAEGYFSLTSMKSSLQNELDTLKNDLSDYKAELQRSENQLAHPTSDMLPPEVFQNKVTIYPVRVESEQ